MEYAIKQILVIAIAFEIQSIICILLGIGFSGTRATGVTTNANTLGIYSNLSLLGSYFFYREGKKNQKFFFQVMMVASVITAIASGSRTALVTVALNCGTISYISIKNKVLRLLLVIGLIMGLGLLFSGALSFLGVEAIDRLAAHGGMSRGNLWRQGLAVWRRFPIFGCGYAISYKYNTVLYHVGYQFHNSYITYIAETGIWGVITFGLYFIVTMLKNVRLVTSEMRKSFFSAPIIVFLMMFELLLAAYSESFLFAVGSAEACTFWVLFSWMLVWRKKVTHCDANDLYVSASMQL